MSCGCTCSTTISTLRSSRPGANGGPLQSSFYEQLSPVIYVIVDHAAAVGAGTRDAQSLHPIEPASVREEVEAAGFVLHGRHHVASKDVPD